MLAFCMGTDKALGSSKILEFVTLRVHVSNISAARYAGRLSFRLLKVTVT